MSANLKIAKLSFVPAPAGHLGPRLKFNIIISYVKSGLWIESWNGEEIYSTSNLFLARATRVTLRPQSSSSRCWSNPLMLAFAKADKKSTLKERRFSAAYGPPLSVKLEFRFRTKQLGSRPVAFLTTPLEHNSLLNSGNQTLQSQADMLKLFLPDVGPMPTATDWASKTDEELAQALTAFGHEPGENIVTNIRKLVRLERQELFTWMSHVAANHGRNHSDLALLMPVIMRRVKMGTEQIEMVRKRWVDEKLREMGEARAVGIQMLEWAEATLRAALGDPATAATAAATIESVEGEIELSDHESI